MNGFLHRVSIMGASVAVLLACGSQVETTTAGGNGVGGSGLDATNVGGCGGACVACCNDPHCPEEPPIVTSPCEPNPNVDCGYVLHDGCLQYYYCNPPSGTWVWWGEAICPGQCVNKRAGSVCLEPGQECHYPYEGPDGCVHATCGDDHKWTDELEIGAECP